MKTKRDTQISSLEDFTLAARCEAVAYTFLRPVIWRLEQLQGLPPFSDFIDVRTDVVELNGIVVRDDDPSDWAYCIVLPTPFPDFSLCGWLWGHEAKQPRFKQLGQRGRPTFCVPHDHEILRPFDTLIDELIRRPLVTGRTEDGRLPEFGRAPGHPDQAGPWSAHN
jgi:hypothetical protein